MPKNTFLQNLYNYLENKEGSTFGYDFHFSERWEEDAFSFRALTPWIPKIQNFFRKLPMIILANVRIPAIC